MAQVKMISLWQLPRISISNGAPILEDPAAQSNHKIAWVWATLPLHQGSSVEAIP